MYMDYTIVNLKVKNNTDNIISIDTKQDVKTMYLYDTNVVKYMAFLNETPDVELQVRKDIEKSIDIKFDKIYSPKNRTLSRNCFRRCSSKL